MRSGVPSRCSGKPEAGIAAVRPGANAGEVARAENDVFRKHGFGDYTTSRWTRVRGHGLGLFCDSAAPARGRRHPLVPGMALIVHPNTYHPEVGYLVLGDAVVVTDDGVEVLCGRLVSCSRSRRESGRLMKRRAASPCGEIVQAACLGQACTATPHRSRRVRCAGLIAHSPIELPDAVLEAAASACAPRCGTRSSMRS